MNFGAALELLRGGQRVCRSGWNGKGMFLILVESGEWSMPDKSIIAGESIQLLPWIGMFTADRRFVPWLASQTDILAVDWQMAGA